MFLSICPFLKGIGGHDIPYQESLRLALDDTWQFKVLATTAAKNLKLPKFFFTSLPVYTTKTNVLYWWRYILAIRKEIINSMMSKCTLFIESFGLGHLLGLGIAIFFANRKIDRLIILLRTNLIVNNYFKTVALNAVLFFFIEILKVKVLFATDSVLVRNFFNKKFQMNATVLPIPHANFQCREKSIDKSDPNRPIVCWMPGASRPEKNYAIAAKLIINSSKLNQNILWMPGSLKKEVGTRGKHVFFDATLSEEEYQYTLLNCDVVLLPYDSQVYEMATSGIFIECIIAGKYPITSKNSWMSFELARYELHDLSISWNEPKAECELDRIFKMLEDKNFLFKMQKMRREYLNFHNHNEFKRIFNSLLET
jgi:hypothetical protein